MSPRDVPNTDSELVQLEATPEMCFLCFSSLVKELTASRGGLSRSLSTSLHEYDETFAKAIPASAECPLFVTWDKRKLLQKESDFRLRGCIGTLSPRPLNTSIVEYALTSALRDRRFDPIRLHEVPYLRVAVSLLVKYETCSHCHDWSVGVHGIIISFSMGGKEYSATYLPEVAREQGWTQVEAVKSLVRKAGYQGEIGKDIPENKIYCTRYQSSKHRVTYEDYVRSIGIDILEEQHSSSGSCATM